MCENICQKHPPLLGPRLRQLRLSKKLSLKELASRIGTSPSALHRYESGWDRFELRTLRRLASALDARLDVRLEPVRDLSPSPPPSPARLVARLRPLFWDVDLTTRHLRHHPEWVLRRVLQFGSLEDVHLVRLFFGDEAVRRAVRHRSVDPRTRRFWELILPAGEEAS